MKRNTIMRGLVLKVFYPFLMFLGTFMKNRREVYQQIIININNRLVRGDSFRTKRILLLLPHCLQVDECNIRLTHNIYNCERCGKCNIRDIIGLSEENNLELFVATGGTIARKVVKDVRPEAIVAVACERDLSSGLVDTYPLPVLGISNERPHGPCLNTQVNLAEIREAISFFSSD